jgi:hypothetical protein
MYDKRVCDVVSLEGQTCHSINAFRIVEENIYEDYDTVLLDFMEYNSKTDQAQVVSRVRVRKEFLQHIMQTMEEKLKIHLDV